MGFEGKQMPLVKNKAAKCNEANLNFRATSWRGIGDASGWLGAEYARGEATVEVWIE
jgi:hypothetical protein